MKVHLIPGAFLGNQRCHVYALARLNFMHSQAKKLEKLAHIKSNPGSWWSFPILVVTKQTRAINSKWLWTQGITTLKLSQLPEACRSWTLIIL
jgi:hypothetical protein